MNTKIALSTLPKDLNVRCPFCDSTTTLNKWTVWVDPVAKLDENEIVINYAYSSVQCPICKSVIDVWESQTLSLDNIVGLKQTIENYLVDVTEKRIQCPQCKCWNDFYDWKFRGYAKQLIVNVSETNVEITDDVQVAHITKVICDRCGYGILLPSLVTVHVPMQETDKKLILDELVEAIKQSR